MADPANTTARLLSAANNDNATLVRGSPTYLRGITLYNAAASVRWLKLYDKGTAPTSADTPRKSIALPPSLGVRLDQDDYFANGLGYRITTGSADNDSTAPTAGDILGLNLDYR